MNNSRCNPIKHSLDTKRGKSFNFVGKLTEGAYYFNDNFVQDFVSYQGALLACKRSHQCKLENLPELVVTENNAIIDIETNLYWDFVSAGPKFASDILRIYYNEHNQIVIVNADGTTDVIDIKNAAGGIPIYVGDKEPEDKTMLWFTNIDTSEYKENNTVIQNLYNAVRELQLQYQFVQKLMQYGAIAGNATSAARTNIMSTAEPIAPEGLKDPETEIVVEPDKLNQTVSNISIKIDTSQNFLNNVQNLIDGELCWITGDGYNKLYIYLNGEFVQIGGATGAGGVSVDDILALFFTHIGLTSNNSKYRLVVNEDGTLNTYKYINRTALGALDATSNVYIAPRLNINSFFCGGNGNEFSYQSCSHNFVELSNGWTTDVNLDDLYLLYAPNKDSSWKMLKLRGIIKAGSTFLIRGAQCSIKTNTTIINVDEYDMEWYDGDSLISFAQDNPIFYLVYGENNQFYNSDGVLKSIDELSPQGLYIAADEPIKGYVDLVGVGSQSSAEGNAPIKILNNSSYSNLLFVRYFTLDPVSQANKVYNARKSNSLWTYIDLSTIADESLDNPFYYYSKSSKIKFTPRDSRSGKNIFTSKTTFETDKPNMVNITFGRQATDNGNGATRCFNWVSVGYYDEFIEYWGSDGIKHKVESFKEGVVYDDVDFNTFIDVYKRIRWISTNKTAVTTHKIIIKNLSKGIYSYRVGRFEDSSYTSDIMQFTVYADSEVTEFEFVQVSDQQGFNWLEYQAWKKAAYHINNIHPDIKFTINTGDITQNGNRENEWLDYYDGRQFLRNKEEMFTIGNNDLCGPNEYLLGDGTAGKYKINHKNILLYYTYELDPNNSIKFHVSGQTEVDFYMPSLYSFVYGKYQFISINSEFAANTYQCYTDWESDKDNIFKKSVYNSMYNWCEKVLNDWSITNGDCSKCIIYCHEMPYTILTHDSILSYTNQGKERGGSKLNDRDSVDSYRWSRLFKKYGVRLVMGGHKHTYSMTYPIYDAPENYLDENGNVIGELDVEISGKASMYPIMQITDESQKFTTTFWDESQGKEGFVRFELVDRITAPIYVMCQATGYKLVSNKDVPAQEDDNIGWLHYYLAGTMTVNKDTVSYKAHSQQYYPTYIHYELSNSGINVHSYKITNIYTTTISSGAGSFNINSQSKDKMETIDVMSDAEGTTSEYTINFE